MAFSMSTRSSSRVGPPVRNDLATEEIEIALGPRARGTGSVADVAGADGLARHRAERHQREGGSAIQGLGVPTPQRRLVHRVPAISTASGQRPRGRRGLGEPQRQAGLRRRKMPASCQPPSACRAIADGRTSGLGLVDDAGDN